MTLLHKNKPMPLRSLRNPTEPMNALDPRMGPNEVYAHGTERKERMV